MGEGMNQQKDYQKWCEAERIKRQKMKELKEKTKIKRKKK